MIHISMQFYKSGGTSGAGGAGGTAAENTEKNMEIDSSKAWQNDKKPQGGNPPANKDNITHNERVDMIKKALGISDEQAEKYAKALEKYGHDPAGMSGVDKATLEAYILDAARWAGGKTYHATNLNADAVEKASNIGDTVNLKGTSTWYSDKQEAKGNVVYVSDTQSKGTGINNISVHTGDKEVLASDASRYKIKRKYWEGRTLYVQVEEV